MANEPEKQDWIAYVTDSPPGGFGSAESGFTGWFATEDELKRDLVALLSEWPHASPEWTGTFKDLCESEDELCVEKRGEFLGEDSDQGHQEPLPESQREEFRAWLDEQACYWQY